MRKATTKEEVLELYKKYILADLELYNSTCKEGLEIRLQDVVNHLCFENKIPYQWDNNGVDEWWASVKNKEAEELVNRGREVEQAAIKKCQQAEIADIIRRTEALTKQGREFDIDEANYFLRQTKNSDNL